MGKEEDLKELQDIKDELAYRRRDLPETPVEGAAGGAFLGDVKGPEGPPDPFKQPEKKSAIGEMIEKSPALYAGYKGAEKGYELGSKIPIKGAGPVGAVIGAGAAALTAETSLQEAKRNLGLGDDHTDSFSESLAHGFAAAEDSGIAETWGRALGVVPTNLKPHQPSYTPEEKANMTEMQDRLRGVYEKVTGKPMSESKLNWNPFKRQQSMEQEIDDTDAAKKLRAAGLDPMAARRAVIGGGNVIGDVADNHLFTMLQRFVGNSTASKEFRSTRGKMYQMAINDLGDKFGKAIPKEDLGKAIQLAVDGKFDTLTATRNLGMSATKLSLEPNFKFDGARLKFGNATAASGSPGSLVAALGDSPTFQEVHQVREALGVMAHDVNAGDADRIAAGAVARQLDAGVTGQLKGDAKKYYKMWTGADDEFKRAQFNTDFVQGLTHNEAGHKAYAEQVMKTGDVGNFRKFEAAVGPDLANQVRANMWDRVTRGATTQDGLTMRPERMRAALNNDGSYGEKFLRATMGHGPVDGYMQVADAMERLNERAKIQGFSGMGREKEATQTGAALMVANMLGGSVHADVAMKIAGILGAPAALAKIMNSERALRLTTKLADSVSNGKAQRASRIAGYITEAAGLTPAEFIMSSGASIPGVSTARNWREELRHGKFPQTGNQMIDTMTNPGQALGQLGSQQVPQR